MDINASIIDQRVEALKDDLRQRAEDELGIRNDEPKLKSTAFIYLCIRTLLDTDADSAFDCLVEGGGDFGVDALHISDEYDGEFTVTIFQGKYKGKLDAKAGFPASGIEKLVQAVRHIFDPGSVLRNINERLRTSVEQVRSLIRDGFLPQVRIFACNNGKRWEANGDEIIELSGFSPDQVIWEHVNHDRLVRVLQAVKPVSANIQLSGKAIVEDMNFSRVLVGRVAVEEVGALLARHGERLLERNIRRYLGLQGNRVNEGMRATLEGDDRANFYFYNNGITLTCEKFSYNALQGGDYKVQVENLQIINGGQTCMTIYHTLENGELNISSRMPAYVLVRLYQLPSDNDDLVGQITFATNSQNPVDLRDLRSNDERQRRLQLDIEQLGYVYRRMRTESVRAADITSGTAAAAILSVWRRRPHQAKFYGREHFGKLYQIIFSDDLTGAEVVIAVLIFRLAENRRRRPRDEDPLFVRYASCFIAMQMGRRLLSELKVSKITHEEFDRARSLVASEGSRLFKESVDDVEAALRGLYRAEDVSRQQLAATFRRGDLVRVLCEAATGTER